MLLRIVGGPVLPVEQGIGDARVRLIHPDDVTAGGKGAGGGLRLLGLCVARVRRSGLLLGGDVDRCRFSETAYLNVLQSEHAQQLSAAGRGLVLVGNDVGCWAIRTGFLDGALRL